MAAVGDKQDLVWFPIDTIATALNLSCTAYWKVKFTPRLEARLVNWAECIAKNGSSRRAHWLRALSLFTFSKQRKVNPAIYTNASLSQGKGM